MDGYNFHKLTPMDNIDLKIYDEAITFALKDKDIKNVAITGSYGAGKSSVIESYKAKHPEFKFLHISLAHFEQENDERIREDILEGKILNQLIQQIDPDNIPQSKYKSKKKVTNKKLFKLTSFFMVFLISLFYMIGYKNISVLKDSLSDGWVKGVLEIATYEALLLIFALILTFITSYFIFLIIKKLLCKNLFKRLKIQNLEMEVFGDNEESFFNKNLNEVVYLFKNSQADVIVFEDFDRFDNNKIFENLREVNYLINRQNEKLIRFFYLQRDDIFVSKDRAKFFDFIIPIVPVIDSSNSYEQFFELFKNILDRFDLKFLRGLSLYIDDMRILKNIYNEYIIYEDRIQSTELDDNKLLALITYKNLFPNDFNELQFGRGFVYNIFANLEELINNKEIEIDKEIQSKQEDISLIKNELLQNIDELDALYLRFGNNNVNVKGRYDINYNNRAEFISDMKANRDKVFQIPLGHVQNIIYKFDDTYEKLNENSEYLKRKKLIEEKSNNTIINMEQEIINLKTQKSKLEGLKIADLNSESIFESLDEDFTNVSSDFYYPLIKYLIINGFIDEAYPDYLTYFYENSISRTDKIFIRSISERKKKEFNYSLDNPDLILPYLKTSDFYREEILNFDLLDSLINHKLNILLEHFIYQLKENERFDFVFEYIQNREERHELHLFIDKLNQQWINIVDRIISSNVFSNDFIDYYLVLVFYSSTKEVIKKLNINNCINDYISSNPYFLNVSKPNVNKIISALKLLDIKFRDIKRANLQLFKVVYERNYYEINMSMLSSILEKVYNIPRSDDFRYKNYSLVVSKPNEPLVAYIKKNISLYMNVILENCDSIITDTEEAAIEILNNHDINLDVKEVYLEYLETQIQEINSVNIELWSLLLEKNIIKYTADNILNYYFKNNEEGFDQTLIKFINEGEGKIVFDKKSFDNDETKLKFYRAMIICNDLSDSKYKMLINNNNWYYYKSPISISETKMRILIDKNIFRMSGSNLLFIRERYKTLLRCFILANAKEYLNIINENNFSYEELIWILESKVQIQLKLKLMRNTVEPISVKMKNYTEAVKAYILANNFDINDLPYLAESFSQHSSKLKHIIISLSAKHIGNICNFESKIDFELIIQLFNTNRINTSEKINLLINNIKWMKKAELKACLIILGMSDYIGLLEGKRPKFSITDENNRLLSELNKKDWITGYDVDKKEPSFYRANGKRK